MRDAAQVRAAASAAARGAAGACRAAALLCACWLGLQAGRDARAQPSCTPPASSLVHWFRAEDNFNDGRGPVNGTASGGVTFAEGRVRRAFSFDGLDDGIFTSATGIMNAFGPLTVEAWVRPALRTGGAPDRYPNVVGANRGGTGNEDAGRGFGLDVFADGSQLTVARFGITRLVPGVSFAADTWYHVAVVYTDIDTKVYVNGRVVDHFAPPDNAFNVAGDNLIRIGYARTPFSMLPGTPSAAFFKGRIDEVGIYNAPLSPDDIQAIYNASVVGKCTAQACAPPPPELAAWYAAENNAADSTGAHEGRLFNGVTFTAGRVGQAFTLDGVNDYVRLPDNFFPSRAGASPDNFSFEVWFRTTAGGVILGQQDAAAFSQDLSGWIPALYVGTDGRLYAQPFFFQPQPPLSSPFAVNDGLFHHAVVTYGSGDLNNELVLYLDGVRVASKQAAQSDYADNYRYQLGTGFTANWPATNGEWYSFAGQIDEASVYRRRLIPHEVAALFSAGGAGKCALSACAAPLPHAGNLFREQAEMYPYAIEKRGVGFAPGRIGQAYHFDGLTSGAPAPPPEIYKPASLTLSGWVRFRTLDSFDPATQQIVPNGRQYIAFAPNSRTAGGRAAFALYKSANQNRLTFEITTADGFTMTAAAPEAVAPGRYYHVAATFDAVFGTMRLYVDGVQRAVLNTSAVLDYAADGALSLGAGHADQPDRLAGVLDEVQLYERALPLAEVQSLFNAGRSGNCASNPVTANDNFAGAQTLLGRYGRAADTNQAATKEANEPSHAGQAGGGSLWYRWQAPFSGRVLLTSFGSDFDTVLGVYTGASVGALTQVAANDDNANADNLGGRTLTSSLGFNAVAGVTYYFAVDGAGNRRGHFTLAWGPEASISGHITCGIPDPNRPNNCNVPTNLVLVGEDARIVRLVPQFLSNNTFIFRGLRVGGTYRVYLQFDQRDTYPIYGPRSFDFPFLSGDVTSLYSDSLGTTGFPSVTLSGRVARADGAPIGSIPVSVTGTASRTVLTDPDGFFTLSSLPNDGNYTVMPAHPEFSFKPLSLTLTNVRNDVADMKFDSQDTYTISGQVRDAGGSPIVGATLGVSGTQPATALSGADGFYTVAALAGESHTVTASKAGFQFGQPSLSFPALAANQKNADFVGAALNPAPSVSSLSPSGVAAGSAAFTLTVNGSNFVNSSTVRVGGSDRATTFVSATQLTAQVLASDVQAAGTRLVTVFNPAPGGGTSAAANLTVTDPQAPRLDSVTPRAGRASGGQQVTLSGSFPAISSVSFGGAAAAIVSQSATQIIVTSPAHAPGAVSIDLVPSAGTALSAANAFAYLPTAFTDDTLLAGVTLARAQHVTELRGAVDALRLVTGLAAAQWTDPALVTLGPIRAVHITELRTHLEQAAAALGLPPFAYTDPGLSSGGVVKRAHIEELRQRIRSIAG